MTSTRKSLRGILIKTPQEIEGVRLASALTGKVLDEIGAFVKPGISTLELDQIANEIMIRGGGHSACIDYLGNNKWGK